MNSRSKPTPVKLTDIYSGKTVVYASQREASSALGKHPKYIHSILYRNEFARGSDGRVYDVELIK